MAKSSDDGLPFDGDAMPCEGEEEDGEVTRAKNAVLEGGRNHQGAGKLAKWRDFMEISLHVTCWSGCIFARVCVFFGATFLCSTCFAFNELSEIMLTWWSCKVSGRSRGYRRSAVLGGPIWPPGYGFFKVFLNLCISLLWDCWSKVLWISHASHC